VSVDSFFSSFYAGGCCNAVTIWTLCL